MFTGVTYFTASVRSQVNVIKSRAEELMRVVLAIVLLAAACAPLATQKQADAAFRKAVAAQIGGDSERAEVEYRRGIKPRFHRSPGGEKLGGVAVRPRAYNPARRGLPA